jgi:outer membrane protein assembly factor BamD (BamD/ComL family)
MQRSIQEGKYSEAITTGEAFISKKPDSPDVQKVQPLLMDAEFRLSRTVDTLERYDAYDRKFPGHPFKTDLIAAEYVLYKAMNTLDGYDEFNRKFPDHPYRNEVIQAEFDLYKEMNTLEGYDAFNGKFPGHDFQNEVVEAEYALYKAMDTLEGFETFEKKFPSHSFTDDLAERKSVIYYQTVTLPKSSSAAFKDFLSRYPNSSFAQEAREKANQAAYVEIEASWKEAGDKNTVEAFEAFCTSYPDSHRVAEARERICEIAWKEAETLNTIDACLSFKNDHSACIAQVKLAESKAEDMAWKDAVGKNTPEAYKQFREQYPVSLHVNEAQAKERENQKFSNSKIIEEKNKANVTSVGNVENEYLFDVLKKSAFKKSWNVLFKGEKKVDSWLSKFSITLNGVTAPLNSLNIKGVNYTTHFLCKPHFCPEYKFYVIFSPNGHQAWGLYAYEDPVTLKIKHRLFGKPDRTMKEALVKLIESE